MTAQKLNLAAALVAALFCVHADADIVYLDATDTNTATDSGTPADGGWETRTVFGTNGAVYEGRGTDELLTTTVSGLAAGSTYDVFVYIWDSTDNGHTWRATAGLAANDLDLYIIDTDPPSSPTDTAITFASASTFSGTAPLFTEANRTLYQISLGSAAANGSGEISVFVRTDTGQTGGGFRTWYDGVGTELTVIPEPASLALMGIGGLMLLGRGRRAG